MVDTLLFHLPKTKHSEASKLHSVPKHYALLTLHRPSNVDKETDLMAVLKAIEEIQKRIPVVFPVHPRTAQALKQMISRGTLAEMEHFHLLPPLGYIDFIHLLQGASLVLTDSGGVQEETTVLGIPCVTLRDNTERPITIAKGTNVLAGRKTHKIIAQSLKALFRKKRSTSKPRLWDGHAADRIVKILSKKFHF
jgi:UDP-N-acetylglucosamine 2-epimerase (non-hydrolysing)